MKTNTAGIVFFLGLIVTMFGVGGVENSILDSELMLSVLVSAVGLAIMYCATLAMKVSDYYDTRG